jgi:hypothetical protein
MIRTFVGGRALNTPLSEIYPEETTVNDTDFIRELETVQAVVMIDTRDKLIERLVAALEDVDAWVTDVGLYAEDGHNPAPVFLRVKSALAAAKAVREP